MTPAPTLTYEIDGALVHCKAHCRDLAERDAVYEIFRGIPNSTLSASSDPPTATVILPIDHRRFQREQQAVQRQAAAHQERIRREVERRDSDRRIEEGARQSLTRIMQTRPEDLYGKRVSVIGRYEGLDPLPGDKTHELGFAIRENGSRLPCVVFVRQIAGDPYTQSIPILSGDAVKLLHPEDRIRVTGQVFSPTGLDTDRQPSLRRARPFFVVDGIERI
jgi:hypothetical protein